MALVAGRCPECHAETLHADRVTSAGSAWIIWLCHTCQRGGIESADNMDPVIGLGQWLALQVAGGEVIEPARIPRYNYGAFRSDVPVVIGTLAYEDTVASVKAALLRGDELLGSGVKVLVDVGYPPLLDGEVGSYDDETDVWHVRLT